MTDFRAPDMSSRPINTSTAQSLIIPNGCLAFLSVTSHANWEQAVVVYVDGIRLPELVGTRPHADWLELGYSHDVRHLLLAGWHKRSPPDASQPWVASRGETQHEADVFVGATCRWDDSGGDDDFDDCVVRLELIPTFVAPMPVVTTKTALASPAVTAHALVSIAAIAAAADASDDEELKRNVKAQSEESIRSIAERYRRARSAVDPFPAPLSSALILAAHLELQLASMSQDSAVAAGLKDAQRILLRKRDRTDGVSS